MKKSLHMLLCLSVFFLPAAFSDNTDSLESFREQTQDLYRTGSGAQDATFSTVGKSMWAWGIGLSAAIAILASAIHQSNSSKDNNSK